MEDQAALFNTEGEKEKSVDTMQQFDLPPMETVTHAKFLLHNSHNGVLGDFVLMREQKKEKVIEEEELTKSDEEDLALEQTLGENVLLGAELDLEEMLKMGTLTLEDGCDRDETGWVKPTETSIPPSEEPWKPTSMVDILGVTHFKAGTSIEEMNAYEPPEHLQKCWQGAQDIFNKKWKKEIEEEPNVESRASKRALARKQAKIRRKAEEAAVKFEQQNKN